MLFVTSVLNWVFTDVIQSLRFTNDYKFVYTHISSRHSNLNFATILLFIDCSKMARIRINIRTHTKEKPYLINSFFFFKIGKAKKVNIGEQNRCMYVSEICAEGIFVTFPWWLKNVKIRSEIAPFFFQMSAILKFDFQKRKQLRFSEVNYLNYTKKTQFCMWQLHFP